MPESSLVIWVVGSLNTDLITRTTRIPGPGETLKAKSFSTGCGGKGANQAVACSRLSRRKGELSSDIVVKMIGMVGDDLYGEKIRSGLRSSGVDIQNVMTDYSGVSTGTAVIIVEEETGENRILITPGANDLLTPEMLGALNVGSPGLVVLQLEIPLDAVIAIIKYAKENKLAVLLNPAPAVRLPLEVYKGLNHLIMNESEAEALAPSLDNKCTERLQETSSNGLPEIQSGTQMSDDLQKFCTHFHHLGVQNVVITLGAKGLFYSTDLSRPGEMVPAAPVTQVVDTTAAGDTFVGAYAVAIVQEYKVRDAVAWANRAAAKTVEKEGAMDAIPWMEEVR
ncbi:MAG: hypothetical protein Q9220_003858 [cf. Caloplaca sp. 1 TL-2023]